MAPFAPSQRAFERTDELRDNILYYYTIPSPPRCFLLLVDSSGCVWRSELCDQPPCVAALAQQYPGYHLEADAIPDEDAHNEEGNGRVARNGIAARHITVRLLLHYFNCPALPPNADDSAVESRNRMLDELVRAVPLHIPPSMYRYRDTWENLRRIPFGRAVSYDEFLRDLGNPDVVGKALQNNPFVGLLPSHRIVGRHPGLLGFASQIRDKQWLMQRERRVAQRVTPSQDY
uniref:methylated-DNA--[protein]-cysteine S-methyltransferase n=1 Tax=Trypanosoma congolense (strain IL3000) TaxID=1068625 RepID=G0UTH6_TRYCI|nr:conserved hypothetical protein [Trypanosoma congolense IL3000]